MRRAKRNAAKLLSAAMAVGMMAGMAVPAAAEEESNNIWASDVDTSEPMELKMYLIGDRTPDFDEVYGKINEILEEKLNCTLSVDFLSWGEHDTKYSLLFSGGEDFDYRLQPVELLGVFRVPKNEEQFNNKPPAMRVRVECYTKKITFPCTIELFRLYCRKER